MESGHEVNGHLHGAQFDPAHQARLEKRDWMRGRKEKWKHVPGAANIGRQGDVRDDAGDQDRNPLPHIKTTSWPDPLWIDPHEHGAFRKLGTYQEIPLYDASHPEGMPKIGSPQAKVNYARVRELATNPELGKNPRFPASHVERPSVIKMGDGTHAVINGNHRFLAHALRGELFAPAHVVEGGDAGVQRYSEHLEQRHRQKRAAGKKSFARKQNQVMSEAPANPNMTSSRMRALAQGIFGDRNIG